MDCLEKLYKTAKIQNVKICGGLRSFKLQDGSIVLNPLHRKVLKRNPNGILLHYLDYQFDYHFHSYIYDRKFILENNCLFGTWQECDDGIFFARAMFAAKDFFVIPVETYCYRLHAPYDWNYKQTMECIKSFTDMLKFSKENKLAILHWIIFCRMNCGLFYSLFIKHIHNELLFNALVKANSYIDSELLSIVQKNMPGDEILEPMGLPNEKQKPLENGEFILNALLYVFNNFKNITPDVLNNDHSSISCKIGRYITFIPRICMKILKSIKYNGLVETARICKLKVKLILKHENK